MALCVYYLDEALNADDAAFVLEELDPNGQIEQRRIPHVLPLLDKFDEAEFKKHSRLLQKALGSVGINEFRSEQVALVAPAALYWYSVLLFAVAEETGFYPYLIQTSAQRQRIGNPGSTRILNGESFMADLR